MLVLSYEVDTTYKREMIIGSTMNILEYKRMAQIWLYPNNLAAWGKLIPHDWLSEYHPAVLKRHLSLSVKIKDR